MTGISNVQHQVVQHEQTVPLTLPEEGTLIEGEVVEKQAAYTKVRIDQHIVEVTSDVPIEEAKGEMAAFRVVKGVKDKLTLKYIAPEAGRDSVDLKQSHKGTSVQRHYNQTLTEVLQPFGEADAIALKALQQQGAEALRALAETMTDVDLKVMFEDGLNPEKVSIELLAQAVKHNKVAIRQGDFEAVEASFRDAVKQMETVFEPSVRLTEIAEVLRSENLPVVRKQVERLVKGAEVADQVNKADMSDRLKLVALSEREGTPTLEQVYRQLRGPEIQRSNYELTPDGAKELVVRYFENEQIETTDARVEAATEMLLRDIPLTVEAVDYVAAAETEEKVLDAATLIKAMGLAVATGEKAMSVTVEALNFYPDDVSEPKSILQNQEVIKTQVSSESLERVQVTQQENVPEQQPIPEKAYELKAFEVPVKRAEALKVMVEQIHQLKDVEIAVAVSEQKDRTIGDLVSYVNYKTTSGPSSETAESGQDQEKPQSSTKENLDYIQRRLQVEEIRLKMTVQAALRLEKGGLKIDTAPIEQVVESLREEEYRITQAKVQAYKRPDSEVDVEAVKEALDMAGYAKMRHDDAVAQAIKQERPVSIASVLEASNELKGLPKAEVPTETVQETHAKETRIKEAAVEEVPAVTNRQPIANNNPYETTMTEIRPDLGDRLENTFSQIEPMLVEMGLEPTEANQKAVQILARNEMPITPETIAEIQVVHEKIDFALSNMTPLTVVRVIEAGINPMELSIDELNNFILALEGSEGMTQAEKISQMIQSLDRSGELTSEQRQGLMAVYRTFDTVLRSDGAATGFLVKREMPLTVDALFEAAKYLRRAPRLGSIVQADVDDGFGKLENTLRMNETLRGQMHQAVENLAAKQEVSESNAPDSQELTQDQNVEKALMDVRILKFVDVLTEAGVKDLLVGEEAGINRSLPLEELTHLMKVYQTDESLSANLSEVYNQVLEGDPEVLEIMVNQRIPLTFDNFRQAMAMNENTFLLMDQIEMIVQNIDDQVLRNEVFEVIKDAAEDVVKGEVPYERLSEALETVESLLQSSEIAFSPHVYKSAENAAKTVNHTQMIQVTEDYYQIPVMMDGQVHQLNMVIFNDSDTAMSEQDGMQVVMSFDTRNIGKVQAHLTFKGNQVQMNISSDQPSEAASLKDFEEAFSEVVNRTNFTLEGISYNRQTIREPVETDESTTKRTEIREVHDGHLDLTI